MRDSLLRFASVCAVLVSGFLAGSAGADDFADEADLQFRLGADRYTAGDYRGALEHFLASNRLVPNRNVVFNIARSYEKLEQYPEAFRYYEAAFDAETDPSAQARITQALQQIRPHVAVIDIQTDPPGATIYVDRKDLGPRGESPLALGLPAGTYKLIVERPGYYRYDTVVERAAVGSTRPVRIDLKPILGVVRVEGAERGAEIRVDDADAASQCSIPCRLELPPGRHLLYVSRPGHRSAEISVDVAARAESIVSPRLEAQTGAALVTTDEPGALVEVDGKSRGFTPAILALPAGEHRLRISSRGFRTIERTLVIVADRQTRVDALLSQAEEVQAASRVAQDVEDAPSSVTIIPREEIVAFGYPTIVDAVRGVRGMYTWNDRSYASLGVRGLGVLGSYTNRELVLQDGHPTNDDWIGSAYVGFDGRTDLADVERIEIVRGPGSVLYGTNAFSGVINLVTRYNREDTHTEVGISAVDAGVLRGRVRSQASLGKDAGIWASASSAHGAGRDFFFPELGNPNVPNSGVSRNADGFNAGTVQGRVYWRWLTAQWFLTSHDKTIPTGEFSTLVGDPRTSQVDTRGFVEARAEPVLSKEVQLFSRLYLNSYRFRGDYARSIADAGIEHDTFTGYWAGIEQRIVIAPSDGMRFTLGGEGQSHFKVQERARDDTGYFLDDSGKNERNFRVGAVYGLADIALGRDVRVSGGVRLDAYSTFGSSLNPRAAVIWKPYDGGNTKFMGGKAFRAPSVYELYYNDGGYTQVSSPDLHPESIYSFEIEHSHRFSPTVTGLGAVYANYVRGLIVQRGAGDQTSPLYYVNSDTPIASVGGEVGVRREWRQGWMLQATYGYQHSTYLASESSADLFGLKKAPGTRNVANSPEHLASIKAAAPILARGLTAATRVTLEGIRYDRYENDGDPAQGKTNAAVIWDLILSGREERWGLGYSIGAYNVGDWRYSFPVSGEFTQRAVQQNGRTFLASADITF